MNSEGFGTLVDAIGVMIVRFGCAVSALLILAAVSLTAAPVAGVGGVVASPGVMRGIWLANLAVVSVSALAFLYLALRAVFTGQTPFGDAQGRRAEPWITG